MNKLQNVAITIRTPKAFKDALKKTMKKMKKQDPKMSQSRLVQEAVEQLITTIGIYIK